MFRAATRNVVPSVSFFFFHDRKNDATKKKRHPSIVSPIIARLELIKKIPIDDEIFIPSRNGRSVSGKLK